MVNLVNGYHGTHKDVVEVVLNEGAGAMRLSANEGDWLGDGIYFWQDGPNRAQEWAKGHHADAPAVLHAQIELSNCFDLVDLAGNDNIWLGQLKRAYEAIEALYTGLNRPMPTQSDGNHKLDRAVINQAVTSIVNDGTAVWSTRGAFREGIPVYPGSAIYHLSHIQIAVRDAQCIMKVQRAS